jgi:hypothetical protein
MAIIDSEFESREAPCGQVVSGKRHQDRDDGDMVLLTDSYEYACGCLRIRRTYHDGSFSRRLIHHNGAVLVDELHGKV